MEKVFKTFYYFYLGEGGGKKIWHFSFFLWN